MICITSRNAHGELSAWEDSTSLGIDVETGRQSAGWDGKTVLIKKATG